MMTSFFISKTNIKSVRPLKKDYIVILVTCKDLEQAEKITRALLEEHLIACGNIVNPVESFFHWLGKIDKADECLVLMKSRMDLFSRVVDRVKSLHSYELPEILALPIVEGSEAYLDWMRGVLQF
jgi:periplasmic divalent cation tolerance protein